MSRILILAALSFYTVSAGAWGQRGHDTICQAATFLAQPESLRLFLQNRAPQMGYLCNIPDTYWRSLPGDAAIYGSPSHYLDTELLGLPIDKIPTDYKKIIADFQGKPSPLNKNKNIESINKEFGSMWWRADQFARLATEAGKKAKSEVPPQGKKEEQNEALPYNQAITEMVNSMGLMGHFVGDASMPFHSSLDHDGYGTGHGGIHAFYENDLVGMIDAKLIGDVVTRAQSLQKSWKPTGNIIERMRELSKVSHAEIKKILALDKTKKASIFSEENGIEIKKPADRELNMKSVAQYRPLILEQMARSAILLSTFWSEAYKNAGEPELKSFKSYSFPHKPNYVNVDYMPMPSEKK